MFAHVHVTKCTYVYAFVCAYVYVYACVCVCACVCVFVFVCVHAHVHDVSIITFSAFASYLMIFHATLYLFAVLETGSQTKITRTCSKSQRS